MSGSLQALQTGAVTYASGRVGAISVTNGYYPDEGSRVVTLQFDWTTTTGYAEDLSHLVELGLLSTPQTFYIDNSTNLQTCTLLIPATNQVLSVPPQCQGIWPAMFSGMPRFQASVPLTSNTLTRVSILNIPMAPYLWSATGGGSAPTLAQLTALIAGLPTALPAAPGILWLNGGILAIS